MDPRRFADCLGKSSSPYRDTVSRSAAPLGRAYLPAPSAARFVSAFVWLVPAFVRAGVGAAGIIDIAAALKIYAPSIAICPTSIRVGKFAVPIPPALAGPDGLFLAFLGSF